MDTPQFPWPPPVASATVDLTGPLLESHPPFTTFGDADKVLQVALRQTGYVENSYFAVPKGFALVTKLERIESFGASRPEFDRWLIVPTTLKRFSLRDYLRALFTADLSHFRMMVFVVSDIAVTEGQQRTTEPEALTWLREGRQGLPYAIAAQPWTLDARCSVLIYEFVHDQQQQAAQIVVPTAIGGLNHLLRAGTNDRVPKLWGALGL